MNKYETLFLIKPDQSEEQIQAVLDRLVQQIEATGGKAAVIEHWGNRKLAYPVRYRGERLWRGYYVLLTYLGEGSTVDEVERNIKIMDPAFRYLSVKLEDDVDPASVSGLMVTYRSQSAGAEKSGTREPEKMEAVSGGGDGESGPGGVEEAASDEAEEEKAGDAEEWEE